MPTGQLLYVLSLLTLPVNIRVLICFRFDLAQTRRPQPLQNLTPNLKLDFTTKKLFLFAWEELAIEESSPRFGLC